MFEKRCYNWYINEGESPHFLLHTNIMENKNMHHKQQEEYADWKSVFLGFASNMAELLSANVSAEIRRKMRLWKKHSAGTAIMFVGLVFFLIAAVLFINSLMLDTIPWFGYLIVGLATLAIGYVMTKE